MSGLVAMAGLWAVEDGYAVRAWRSVEGSHFSPMGSVRFGAQDLGAGVEALLSALDLSKELSATPWSAAEADADWMQNRTSGPASQGMEVRLDEDADGVIHAWIMRLDAKSRHVCQAIVPCDRNPEQVRRAVEELLQGGGDPAPSDADLDLAARTLMLWLGEAWDDEAALAALRAIAMRVGSTPWGQPLSLLVDAIQGAQPDARDQGQRLYEELRTATLH